VLLKAIFESDAGEKNGRLSIQTDPHLYRKLNAHRWSRRSTSVSSRPNMKLLRYPVTAGRLFPPRGSYTTEEVSINATVLFQPDRQCIAWPRRWNEDCDGGREEV